MRRLSASLAVSGLISLLAGCSPVGLIVAGVAAAGGGGGGGGGRDRGRIPDAPTGLVATAGDQQVTLQFNAVPNATSYNLYWSLTSGVDKVSGTRISAIPTIFIHSPIPNDIAHHYPDLFMRRK